MELLWGTYAPASRGPKQGLRIDQIVAAAITLADEEGLEAVSMRKVGERLGTSAMALYTYVPGKEELLEVMLDAAFGELATTYPSKKAWRGSAEAAARAAWDFYQRHPWVMQVSVARALLGPNELAWFEANLAVFDGIGLSGQDQMWAASTFMTFVSGSARQVADARSAEQLTGQSDDEWWHERSALLSEMQPSDWDERNPVSARLAAEGVFEQPHRAADDETTYMEREALDVFEFGLARLLDGIGALVVKPRSRRSPRVRP